MYWEQAVQCEAGTDVGLRRKNNEDSHCVHLCPDEAEWRRCGHLLVVADGMGGHAVGELASQIAVETVPHTFLKSPPGDPRRLLRNAILAANQAINERGTQNIDFHHMGTTCSVLALTSRGAVIGHVGDSRVYRVRRDRIDQLTFDHSLQWELERQHGNFDGIIDLNQHRNIITRSLGPEKSIEVDIEGPMLVMPGDAFLLCSDGLSNQLCDAELGAIVRELPPAQAVKLMIDIANLRGGPDNITAVVARVGELPANVYPQPVEDYEEDEGGVSWAWLGGMWAAAFGLACGLALWIVGQEVKGLSLLAIAVTALFWLLIVHFRHRHSTQLPVQSVDDSKTHHSRPHRTAVGLSSKDLAELLAKIDGELCTAAQADQWKVNWAEHGKCQAVGLQHIREKRYSKAIRDLARSIRVIMEQIPRNPR
ncbi:PP2C family protein-serine/threonine phosphatase [Planctomicrobium sp. SH527]|uniref:PP2C family protein-serine/threonine phosphatase n=1 Tax=Planctomicrobium sp. SH527 TaxID=3448123 RepID=UPI003F5B28FA